MLAGTVLALLGMLDGTSGLNLSEADVERFVLAALNVTRGHGGECAVGVGCGLAAGWLVRKLQGAMLTAAVLGGVGTGFALHQGWVSSDGVHAGARAALNMLTEQAHAHSRRLDLDGDGRRAPQPERRSLLPSPPPDHHARDDPPAHATPAPPRPPSVGRRRTRIDPGRGGRHSSLSPTSVPPRLAPHARAP